MIGDDPGEAKTGGVVAAPSFGDICSFGMTGFTEGLPPFDQGLWLDLRLPLGTDLSLVGDDASSAAIGRPDLLLL